MYATHNKYAPCTNCSKRNCRKSPKKVKGPMGDAYRCTGHREHSKGFKLEEVYHEKERQMGY